MNYIVSTPDRRQNTQLCHINMLKSYVNRDKNNVVQCANIVSPVQQNCNNVCDTQNSQNFENKIPGLSSLQTPGRAPILRTKSVTKKQMNKCMVEI